MHLLEIYLPLNSNDGTPQQTGLFQRVREELIEQFGGVTAFTRNPARGITLLDDSGRCEDDIIVYEVLVEVFDRAWWEAYKRVLEERYEQESVLIRACVVDII
ncbi:hypothetical protein J2W43_001963 [Pseudomonas brassicacearum]|uniref:DUF1330 domain-containing protein n=1 Tax=Pseudomonas brassicacearum TaxID=930166 RepID=A0AAW8M7I1_9PSED|nr:hypothetical protein [Pseudomonas brassicacearum]MDR6957982.1 hypothetical protein [Pseudomonas brassicacearum]